MNNLEKNLAKNQKKILDEGFLANHSYVKKFEKDFSKKVGSKFAVAVNNGTSAIEVPLRALNLNGKDVLLGTNTFIATAIAMKTKMLAKNILQKAKVMTLVSGNALITQAEELTASKATGKRKNLLFNKTTPLT